MFSNIFVISICIICIYYAYTLADANTGAHCGGVQGILTPPLKVTRPAILAFWTFIPLDYIICTDFLKCVNKQNFSVFKVLY
jgi:hypothetical protein